jgi:hypothetical protein
MIVREKYGSCKTAGLLPVTAAAVVGTWIAVWVTIPAVALTAVLLGFSAPPEVIGGCVVPLALVLVLVGILNLVSDVTQLVKWARGNQDFVGAWSRGGRFWRLVLARAQRTE